MGGDFNASTRGLLKSLQDVFCFLSEKAEIKKMPLKPPYSDQAYCMEIGALCRNNLPIQTIIYAHLLFFLQTASFLFKRERFLTTRGPQSTLSLILNRQTTSTTCTYRAPRLTTAL